jgi:hypothetical protein
MAFITRHRSAMERLVTICWILLALIHAPPALALFVPDMMGRLYGEIPPGPVALMLQHRAALFLIVCAIGLAAAFQPDIRKLAVLVFAVSMLSFIALYGLAGWPPGPLRTVAIADAIGLVPLLIVAMASFWHPQTVTGP